MTIIVSVKINDGIVMATDSVSSYQNGMTYHHAIKIVNLVKGLPIGAMVTGAGGIGSESIETLLKDLRKRFAGLDKSKPDWKIDPDDYTMGVISEKLRQFIWEEKAEPIAFMPYMHIRLCGYSTNASLPEVWDVAIEGAKCGPAECVQGTEISGVAWAGETDPLGRLINGMSNRLIPVAITELGLDSERAKEARNRLIPLLAESFTMPDMPIQDAIDLARFFVETTVGYVRFATNYAKTVGGPIEIAAITKHEGFRWVQRKHFSPANLN